VWADLAASRFPVDIPTNFTLFPPAVYDQLRFQEIQPSALQYLIARTRMIDSEAFVALYLQNDSAGAATQLAARLKRVEEFGEPNIWSFVTAENTTRVKKYANALRLSMSRCAAWRLTWWAGASRTWPSLPTVTRKTRRSICWSTAMVTAGPPRPTRTAAHWTLRRLVP
jgi:hypothetical protein